MARFDYSERSYMGVGIDLDQGGNVTKNQWPYFRQLIQERQDKGETINVTIPSDEQLDAMTDKQRTALASRVMDALTGVPLSSISQGVGYDDTLPVQLEEEFYAARDWTRYLMQLADYKVMSREALLGATFAYILSCIHPSVTGDMTGRNDPMPLNLYVNLAGRTGSGKSRTLSTARSLFPPNKRAVETVPASGEGIGAQYVERVKEDGEWHTVMKNDRLLLPCVEVSQIKALATRPGSTLITQILHGYSGEDLGGGTKAKERNMMVQPMSYRLCAIFGVQPAHADLFVNDGETNGLAGRFIYCQTTDPYIARHESDKKPNENIWANMLEQLYDNLQPVSIQYPPTVQREARANIRDTTAAIVGELDGHRVENIGRIAAVYALAEGRKCVSMDDWRLAKRFMEQSDMNRSWLFEQHDKAVRKNAEAKMSITADAKDGIEESKARKTMEYICSKIKSKGFIWQWDIYEFKYLDLPTLHKAMGRYNRRFDEAMKRLVDSREVLQATYGVPSKTYVILNNHDMEPPITEFRPLNR